MIVLIVALIGIIGSLTGAIFFFKKRYQAAFLLMTCVALFCVGMVAEYYGKAGLLNVVIVAFVANLIMIPMSLWGLLNLFNSK